MAGAVWDMDTIAGTLIHPLRYTATPSDAVRVNTWVALATELGSYRMNTEEGHDHVRTLLLDTSDAERVALVREVVLSVEGVAEILEDPEIEVDEGLVSISVLARTVFDVPFKVAI